MGRRTAGWGRKLLYSLVPVVVLLCGAEIVARLVGPPPSHVAEHIFGTPPPFIELDPAVGWRYTPGALVHDPDYEAWARVHGLPIPPSVEMTINDRGMRDTPVGPDKPPGQLRVYSMGDSSVFGSGTPWDESFSQRLERRLNRARGHDPDAEPRAVEVMNAGVAGYSSFQAMALLEDNLDLQPDVVIAYLMNSDLMEYRGSPDSVWFHKWYRGVDLSVLQHSTALRWLSWWHSYVLPLRRAADGMLLRVRVEDFRENLRGLLSLSRRHDFAVIFVVPPLPSDLEHPEDARLHLLRGPDDRARMEADLQQAVAAEHWTGQTRTHFREAMVLEADAAGVPIVDGPTLFLDAWQAAPDRYQGADALFVDRIHPSSAGHALLADALEPLVEGALEGK